MTDFYFINRADRKILVLMRLFENLFTRSNAVKNPLKSVDIFSGFMYNEVTNQPLASACRRACKGVSAWIMEYWETAADRILKLCRLHGLTVGQLAARCHMNKATLDNIIEGKCKKPRIQTLYKIAGVFHLSITEFLDKDVPGCLQPDSSDTRTGDDCFP